MQASIQTKDKSYLTAIARKTLPVPTRWLLEHGYVTACPSVKVLDYGCVKCFEFNPTEWHNYDPFHCPTTYWSWKRHYDIIICNYVLCVLPRAERVPVLKNIQCLLKKEGKAFIAVRNDRPKQGWGKSSKGTYQGRVHTLKLPLIHECSNFRTYLLTTDMELV
jgi:SAM-dependent methyltransferase